MKILLRVDEVWDITETESTDGKKIYTAIVLIFQSIPKALILQVGELETVKQVWDAIKTRHLGADRVREARLQTLMAEFDRLNMKDTDSIDDFVGKLSKLSSKSAASGKNIEEAKIVNFFSQKSVLEEVYTYRGLTRASIRPKDYKFQRYYRATQSL